MTSLENGALIKARTRHDRICGLLALASSRAGRQCHQPGVARECHNPERYETMSKNSKCNERTPLSRRAYPDELKEREDALLNRSAKAGLALSGGGIRSATFGFGVIQALANIEEPQQPGKRKRSTAFAQIDVLSTVSGGGYIGSLISRLFARDEVKDMDDVARAISPARESEATNGSKSNDSSGGIRHGLALNWLRDNGRYLAPNGSGDLLLGGAIIIRNWIAIHVVLATLVLAVFVAMQFVRNLLHVWNPDGLNWISLVCDTGLAGYPPLAKFEAWLSCHMPFGETYLWWSPWVALPAGILFFWAVPVGWAYWLAAARGRNPRGRDGINPLWGFVCACALLLTLTSILTKNSHGIVVGAVVSVVAIFTLGIFCCARQISCFRSASDHLDDSKLRNHLSSKLKTVLVLFAAALVLAVIDTLGQTVYAKWRAHDFPFVEWLGNLFGGLVAAAAGGRRIAANFSGKPGGTRVRPTLNLTATIAAVLLFAFTLTALNVFSHGVAWGFKHPRYVPEKLVTPPVVSVEHSLAGIRDQIEDLNSSPIGIANIVGATWMRTCFPDASSCPEANSPQEPLLRCVNCPEYGERLDLLYMAVVFGFLGVLSWLFGRSWPFLNNSTLLPLYTARLVRAYLGASNPERIDSTQADGDAHCAAPVAVTNVLECDDMRIKHQWWSIDAPRENDTQRKDPFAKGAPLHLVNVTINESLDGRSRVQQNDRKGIGMAIGPAGISAGVRHHVVIPKSPGPKCKKIPVIVYPKVPSDDDPRACPPFRMFDYPPVNCGSEDPRECYEGEPLSLGQWAGISGAAFSTGLGSRTSLGLSFIAGFFNVRLGYWWNSGVDPDRRCGVATKRPKLGKRFTWALPVQSYLLDEFFARFHGTARQWWYLTDGGHFENTGAYELIRRRLPLIVIIDAGADPDYAGADLANLIRKARIDFDAEIKFLDDKVLGKLGCLPKYIGTIETLRGRPRGREPNPDTNGAAAVLRWVSGSPYGPRRSPAHAALAVVSYENRDKPDSLIVYVKPTLVGDEPPDIAQYHADHQSFPQQTTSDQFFDEAQWESYRKLGQLITERVFPKGLEPYCTLLKEIRVRHFYT